MWATKRPFKIPFVELNVSIAFSLKRKKEKREEEMNHVTP
jgi:hypothetical protein